MSMDELPGGAEVGYWMHPSARGTGIATDAVRLLVRHATIDRLDGGLGLRRLTLRTAAGNLASQRVAAKAGFERTGVERAAERLGDGTFDDLVGWDQLLTP
jgi:RimJ/RimL family protein N-acetyltransferase